eukprot:TRINITY_DN3244_c0_g1_i6.p1 TRINITY_DN3244_c0_g1~~TRINITY_DN3244_c0_g1_i6.p1  ORF type:complete len:748 (-),score=147.03 TRINITY_DN3244_c0_g1_i6:125-2098(-)
MPIAFDEKEEVGFEMMRDMLRHHTSSEHGGPLARSDSQISFMFRSLSKRSTSQRFSLEGIAPSGDFEERVVLHSEDQARVPLSYVWQLVYPNILFAIVGVAGSVASGAVIPIFGLIVGSMVSAFESNDMDLLQRDAAKYAVYFLIAAGCQLVFMSLQGAGLGVVGERMTKQLRYDVFRSLLKQEISFFDNPKNAPAILATRLGVDSEQMRKATSDTTGLLLQMGACACGGLLIGFLTNWRMALFLCVFIPVMVFSGLGHMLSMKMQGTEHQSEEAGRLASEAMSGVHFIASFNAESVILDKFSNLLRLPLKSGIRAGVFTGLAVGVSEMCLYLTYAGGLLFGAYLIDRGLATGEQALKVFYCLASSFLNIGRSMERMPALSNAIVGMRTAYALSERKSQISHEDTEGDAADCSKSSIIFKDVNFRYPARPDVSVLRDLSLKIHPGQTVALVGFSGSGKSTVIQLLERFYDPEAGSIEVDGKKLKKLNVRSWRSQIGYVGQEPVLFNLTVRENIKYGKPDATEEEVLEAARTANVMEFVDELPAGLDTPVGSRGGQLSGGQRQRVAIARALIRNPSLLLLDEATSALDNESERLIQEALDRLRQDRTVLVIAHRLSTVRNADKIMVMSQGTVVESGTHDELLSQDGGVYAGLVAAGGV